MKFTKEQWVKIGLKAGFIKEARRKDQHGQSIAYAERYILRKKKHGMEDPYFLGGGSFHAPEMVFLPNEAAKITGDKLEHMAWDWTRDWDAVPVRNPNANTPIPLLQDPPKETEAKSVKHNKVATQVSNTQNQNPDESNFAVDLQGRRRSIGQSKGRINKEIHALGNYFTQIPLTEISDILKKYSIVMLQEDGTIWSGFVTTQGDCGSDQATKQGPMTFDLAVKTESGWSISNNVLYMTACTMPSGKIEIVSYIS